MAGIMQTAAGVAVGHVAASSVMGMMNGGDKSDSHAQEAQPAQQPAQGGWDQNQQQQYQNPCAAQMEQFLQCAKTQSDLTLCDVYNQQFKDCKLQYSE